MAEKRPKKTATKTALATRVPSHGRGRLLLGGKPGNKGGGRIPSPVRDAALKQLTDRALIQRLGDWGAGESMLQFKKMDPETGEPIVECVPGAARDQIQAISRLMEYAEAKPTIEVNIGDRTENFVIYAPARAETAEEWLRRFPPPK